LADSSSG